MEARINKVLSLKAEGFTNREIATKLDLTLRQVQHCNNRDNDIACVEKWKAKGNNKNHYKKRYNRLKELWLPKGTKCAHCGKEAKNRHHVVYGEKEFAFREIWNTNAITEDMIKEEVAKTIPLCIRCHRHIHLGIIIDSTLYSGPIQIVKKNGHLFNGIIYDNDQVY